MGSVSRREAPDCAERPATGGTRVRVLEVDRALRQAVPSGGWEELQAMVGGTFRVCEIDAHGAAWVETSLLPHSDGGSHSHSLALDSHEMEVVSESRRRPIRK